MEDNKSAPARDITKEDYQGPNSTIVGLGYFSAAHHILNVAAIGGLGAIGYFGHEFIGDNVIQPVRNFVHRNFKPHGVIESWVGLKLGTHPLYVEFKNILRTYKIIERLNPETATKEELYAIKKEVAELKPKKPAIREGNILLREDERGTFQCLTSDTLGFFGQKMNLKEIKPFKKVEAGLFMAGFGMILGLLSSIVIGLVHGKTRGHSGSRQFERAKDQINNLREDNADLNKINDELHEKYVQATTRLDREDAAKAEDNRSASLASETAPQPSPAPKPHVQLDATQHQGKMAQPEAAAAVA